MEEIGCSNYMVKQLWQENAKVHSDSNVVFQGTFCVRQTIVRLPLPLRPFGIICSFNVRTDP